MDGSMTDWQDISTVPKDGTVIRLKFGDGRTAAGEYWPAAPIEIDPHGDSEGWAVCLIDEYEGLDL